MSPEGDTIFRAARTLHRALAGRTVVRFVSMFPSLTRVHEDTPLTGRTIESVRSAGKHVVVSFSGGLVLRTHMRMNGSWHVYRPGERWQRPHGDMRIVLATEAFEAVGFNIPDAELIASAHLARNRALSTLGPDLLADDFDAAAARDRLRSRATAPIAEALLNQRIMAGIGNVYKSEVLFACRIHPATPVAQLSDAQIEALIETARRFLRANVSDARAPMATYTGFRRTTRRDAPSERLWVYGRSGKPCRRCGTAIECRKQGLDARATCWCPVCQPSSTDDWRPQTDD